MAGDAYFRLHVYQNNDKNITDFQKEEEIKNKIEEKCGNVFIDWNSIKWHNMIEDTASISKDYPDVKIVIHKHLNDCNLFDDDGDTFSKYEFINGKYRCRKGKVVYKD